MDCDSSKMFYKMAPASKEEGGVSMRARRDFRLPQSRDDINMGQALRRTKRRRVPRRPQPQSYQWKRRFGKKLNIDLEIDTIKKEIMNLLSHFD